MILKDVDMLHSFKVLPPTPFRVARVSKMGVRASCDVAQTRAREWATCSAFSSIRGTKRLVREYM